MVCEDIAERRTEGFREYSCSGIPIARLFEANGFFMLSVDAVDEWTYPIDEELRLGDVGLIYRKEDAGNMVVELVGYRNPVRAELISIRVLLSREPGLTELGSIVSSLVSKYAPNYYRAISRVREWSTS